MKQTIINNYNRYISNIKIMNNLDLIFYKKELFMVCDIKNKNIYIDESGINKNSIKEYVTFWYSDFNIIKCVNIDNLVNNISLNIKGDF